MAMGVAVARGGLHDHGEFVGAEDSEVVEPPARAPFNHSVCRGRHRGLSAVEQCLESQAAGQGRVCREHLSELRLAKPRPGKLVEPLRAGDPVADRTQQADVVPAVVDGRQRPVRESEV